MEPDIFLKKKQLSIWHVIYYYFFKKKDNTLTLRLIFFVVEI